MCFLGRLRFLYWHGLIEISKKGRNIEMKNDKLYYYGYLFRPPMPGSQPRNGLRDLYEQEVSLPCGRSLWGYAVYNRRLTEVEKSDYELIEIKLIGGSADGSLLAEITGNSQNGSMDSCE